MENEESSNYIFLLNIAKKILSLQNPSVPITY